MMMTTSPFQQMNTLLSDEQRRKVLNGTAEERTEVLKALDPDKRAKVLLAVPTNVLAYTPEEFAELGRQTLQLGFQHVESAPLVRSSYMAHRALESTAHHAASDVRGSG